MYDILPRRAFNIVPTEKADVIAQSEFINLRNRRASIGFSKRISNGKHFSDRSSLAFPSMPPIRARVTNVAELRE